MQKQISTNSSGVLLLMVIMLVLLTTVGSCLYSENRYYKKANRELIIQNDSIISVNIELKSAVDGTLKNDSKKTSFKPKKEKTP
jgi:hypothetical protein